MSTHSNIGIERRNGEVDVIYCHSDGYLEGVGATLLEHYQDLNKIEALIALGDISSLDREVGEKHAFDDIGISSKLGWTRAYHRDRGEDFNNAHYATREEFLENGNEEYCYLYSEQDAKWYYRTSRSKFSTLTKTAIKNDEEKADEEEEE